jgi:hypothetical protein
MFDARADFEPTYSRRRSACFALIERNRTTLIWIKAISKQCGNSVFSRR